MPRGASQKREREYQDLKRRFEQEGRYRGRETEVASRIVNKQRAAYGETREERQKDREGRSPDRHLPIRDYQHLTVEQVRGKLDSLTPAQLRQVERYERDHKDRKTLLQALHERRSS